jgi:ABC-2 type transport system permease protein
MRAIFWKEFNAFLSSGLGAIVISAFLIVASLFIWIFPGELNILDSGYADLVPFFTIAPWVFLILIPGITMKMFAEEKKQGTLELLLTKPVSTGQLVFAKYLAAVSIATVALLPTLINIPLLAKVALPSGNLDYGSITGSYLGLVLLAFAFTSVGLFASTISKNQIVAFLISLVLCFVLYTGFDALGSLELFGKQSLLVKNLGILEHYKSIRRGVIDTRDVFYFVILALIFLSTTKFFVENNNGVSNKKSKQNKSINAVTILAICIGLSIFNSLFFLRADLSSDKKYTLKDASIDMVENLEDQIFVRVYLEGDLPVEFRRLRNSTQELLDELRAYAGNKLQYEFINPSAAPNKKDRETFWRKLNESGLQYSNVTIQGKDGVQEKIIFPGAILTYHGKEIPVQLLRQSAKNPNAEMAQSSINNLEYNLMSGISRVLSETKPIITIIKGTGEFEPVYTNDMYKALSEGYAVQEVALSENLNDLLLTDLVIIPRSTEAWSEKNKYLLDQHIMKGGKVIFLLDGIQTNMDSLQAAGGGQSIGLSSEHNLDDMLFSYGVRINKDLVISQNCGPIAVNTGQTGDQPNLQLFPWMYHPLLEGNKRHSITSNLDPVLAQFASSLDTINSSQVKKTILLKSSSMSRSIQSPARISINSVNLPPNYIDVGAPKSMAVLLEGKFGSLYKNRLSSKLNDSKDVAYIADGIRDSKLLIIGDGALFKNATASNKTKTFPLGYDKFLKRGIYGNRDFLLNSVNYMLNDEKLIEIRSRNFDLRLLNKSSVLKSKESIQVQALVTPILMILLIIVVFALNRKKRYS